MANEINGSVLTLDGTTCDPTCFTEDNLRAWMLETAQTLEMDVILGPIFKDVELDPSKLTGDVFQDEGGISGFCMISTSHISIHCWPLRKQFLADVFSCRPFDAMAAIAVAKKHLAIHQLRPLLNGRFPPKDR
jgi:S-adenosylmethionine decarboxylase